MHDMNQIQATPDVPAPPAYARLKTLLITAPLALLAALAGSLMTVICMVTLRLLAGIPTPVELFSYFTLKHIDVHTFIGLLNKYAPNSKTVPLGLALLGMIGLGTALGLVYAAIVRLKLPLTGYAPTRREWLTGAGITLVLAAIGSLLFLDELRQNLLGLPIGWSTFLSIVGLFLDFAVYSVVVCLAYRILLPKHRVANVAPETQARRQLLSRVGVAALTVGAGAGSLSVVRAYLNRYASYDGMETPNHGNVTAPITPNNEHYVVTQNTIDPQPSADTWRLEVTGLVNNPGTYTYEELQKLPSVSRAITLECIANGTGGHLMSTAIWQGVTLATLLKLHGGVQAGAKYFAMHSVDGYTTSLALDEVLAVDPILAWRMNGAVLPQRHGFPLRILIPGRFGEENPKWITRVEIADHFVKGLYIDQGWSNRPLHTTSRIDRPTGRVTAGQKVEVGGIAFAGSRGIQKVELSVNGGNTWQPVELQPALSEDSWVLWTAQWTPTQAGTATLLVRATDGTGITQTAVGQRTVPDGATGYHKVEVQVG